MTLFDRVIKYSIYLLVFLIPLFFLPFSFEVFEYNKQMLLLFLVSLAFFCWLAKMVIYDKEIRFKRSPLDNFVLAFLGVAILSAIFSVDKTSSLYGFYGRFSNGLIGLLSLGLLYFLITNNVSFVSRPLINADKRLINTDKKIGINQLKSASISGILKVFSLSAFLAMVATYFAVFGVWTKIAGFLFLPKIMSSVIFNPTAASLEGFSVFLAVVAVFLAGKILTSAEGAKSFISYLFLASILVLLAIIDFTAAWLILLITLTLLVILSLWKRVFRENVNRLLVPIFLIIVAGVLIPLQPRLISTDLPREQVLNQTASWQISFGAAIDNVKSGFLGSGIGTFHYDFAKEKPSSINQNWLWQVRFDRPGAFIAEVLATMGFLGILSYLALIAIFFMASYFFLQQRSQALLLLMVFSSLVVGQFVYYQNTVLSFLFWIVLGLSVIAWQKPIKEKVVSFKNFPELSLVFSTLVIIIGVGILALYFFNIKFYLADVNYANAQKLSAAAERTALLEKAVRLNPGLPQYRAVLARTYLSDVLAEMEKPKESLDSDKIQLLVATAINQARLATEIAPKQVAMWETLGMVYREIRAAASGATEWGIKSFQTAITLEPKNPVLYTELGKLYVVSNEINKAQEQFQKAIDSKKDYADALIQRALLLEREGDSAGAVTEMEKLALEYPLNSEILFQLGRVYFNNNRVSEAITQFKRVVILVPNHSNAHYSLGVAYAAQGKKTLAIQEFEMVLELNPGNADVQAKINALR